jgi:hypothetical protein
MPGEVDCGGGDAARSSVGREGSGRLAIAAAALTALLAIAGMGVLWSATRWGPGVWTDSIVYLSGARNWLSGLGISWVTCSGVKPIVHYPPLLPLLLAGFEALSVDGVQAGRFLNIAAYGLNGALVGLLAARGSRAPLAAPVATAVYLVAPGSVGVHLGLLTDGPFLTLCLISLVLLACYLTERRIRWLAATAFAAGMAYLMRYTGLALVATILLLLVVLATSFSRLVREVLLFGGLSLAPIAVWFGRNLILTGEPSSYRILYRGLEPAPLVSGLRMMWDWFVPGVVLQAVAPGDLPLVLLSAAAFCGLLVVGVLLVGRTRREGVRLGSGPIDILLALAFFVVYLAVLYASAVFIFIPPTINERMLVPAFAGMLVIGVAIGAWLWGRRVWVLRLGLAAAVVVLVWNKAAWSRSLVERARMDGIAYASLASRQSETIAGLREMDPALIYSNDVAAVSFLGQRPACNLPSAFHVSTAEVDFNNESPDAFRQRLRSEGAVLVLFNRQPREHYAEVIEGLSLVAEYQDGAIYVVPAGPD